MPCILLNVRTVFRLVVVFFVCLFLPRCILVSYYFVASLDGQSDQHHLHRITSTKSSHPPPTMFGWLLHIANKQPPLDAPYHTLGGRVPSSIRVDNHLTEGDVVSPRSTAAQMGEESIISQYSINPHNPMVAASSSLWIASMIAREDVDD